MGRPSKLTDRQWLEVERRLVNGEKAIALAKEFGVSCPAISKRIKNGTKRVKEIANQLATAEKAFEELPISSQINARTLADKLKSVSNHLTDAVEYGAMSAHRLMGIANTHLDQVDEADPGSEASVNALRAVGILTALANESAKSGIKLIAALNRPGVPGMESPETERVIRVVNSPDAD